MLHVTGLFTSSEVQKLVDVTQRQLAYWDSSAVAHPHGRLAQGRGSRRLYTLLDVIQLKLIRRLRQAGLSLQKIRQALINLSEVVDDPAPLAELEILTDGHRILIGKSDETFVTPLDRQYVLRIPLADLITELEKQIASPLSERANGAVAVTASAGLPR